MGFDCWDLQESGLRWKPRGERLVAYALFRHFERKIVLTGRIEIPKRHMRKHQRGDTASYQRRTMIRVTMFHCRSCIQRAMIERRAHLRESPELLAAGDGPIPKFGRHICKEMQISKHGKEEVL